MPNAAVESELQEKEERQLGSMGLLQHLEELRKRVIYSVIAVLVGFLGCWKLAGHIFQWMQTPLTQALKNHNLDPHLAYLNPTDPFNMYMKVGLYAGIFVASPIILYQVWLFISPGLYRHEKRFVVPFLVLSVGLFLSGGFFGHRIVFPVALDFLIGYGGDFKPVITITEYTDLWLTIILGLAIVFEVPIVIGFTAMMGVVDAKFLLKHIRGAVFLFFIVAAILTPTTDPLNMTIYAAPLIGLYILSIGIAWLVHPRQRRKRAENKKKNP